MITNKSIKSTSKKLSTEFMWRGQGGKNYYKPSNMKTTHLFNTLKMIWNHSAQRHQKIRPYKKYSFGPSYTKEYLVKAIQHLGVEFLSRSSTKEEHKLLISHIRNILKDEPKALN